MTARVVLVLCSSEAERLRLALMIEAEGGEVRFSGSPTEGVDLVVTDAGTLDGSLQALAVPVVELPARPNWEVIRHQVHEAISGQVGEADRLAAALVGARMLVVDDSATYREYLRGQLVLAGAEVVTVSGWEAAKTLLTQQAGWDFVLLDLVMPNIDGLEMARRAAALRRDQGGRFVLGMLSSREGSDDMVRSLEAGADVFFGKSLDMVMIRARLGAILRFRALLKTGPTP